MRFYDVEEIVIDYLTGLFPDAPAASKVPVGLARFIRVERIGGTRSSRVSDAATLIIECYDARPKAAYELTDAVREAMAAAPRMHTANPRIYSVAELAGPGSLPDPKHSSHRYTMTTAVTTRGRKAAP